MQKIVEIKKTFFQYGIKQKKGNKNMGKTYDEEKLELLKSLVRVTKENREILNKIQSNSDANSVISRIAGLSDKIIILTNVIAEKDAKIAELLTELDAEKKKISTKNETINELKSEVSNLKREIIEMHRLPRLQAKVTEKEDDGKNVIKSSVENDKVEVTKVKPIATIESSKDEGVSNNKNIPLCKPVGYWDNNVAARREFLIDFYTMPIIDLLMKKWNYASKKSIMRVLRQILKIEGISEEEASKKYGKNNNSSEELHEESESKAVVPNVVEPKADDCKEVEVKKPEVVIKPMDISNIDYNATGVKKGTCKIAITLKPFTANHGLPIEAKDADGSKYWLEITGDTIKFKDAFKKVSNDRLVNKDDNDIRMFYKRNGNGIPAWHIICIKDELDLAFDLIYSTNLYSYDVKRYVRLEITEGYSQRVSYAIDSYENSYVVTNSGYMVKVMGVEKHLNQMEFNFYKAAKAATGISVKEIG